VPNGYEFQVGGEHASEDTAQLIRALLYIVHGVFGGAPSLQLLVVHGAHCGINLRRHWPVASRIEVDARLG
jgi:hypothetical protein